jgi:hypothetical protein
VEPAAVAEAAGDLQVAVVIAAVFLVDQAVKLLH